MRYKARGTNKFYLYIINTSDITPPFPLPFGLDFPPDLPHPFPSVPPDPVFYRLGRKKNSISMILNNIKFTQETVMTTNDLKTLIQNHPKETISQEYSLFERSLVNETSTFLRIVE